MAIGTDFYNNFIALKKSDGWNQLSEEERREMTEQAKALLQMANAKEFAPDILPAIAQAETEKQFQDINRAEQTTLDKVVDPLYKGFARAGTNLGTLGAYGLDVIGADETAQRLSEEIEGRQATLEEVMPGQGKNITEMGLSDIPRFGYETIVENIPSMLMTAGAGVAAGGTKAAQFGATMLTMSLPEIYPVVKKNGGGALAAMFFALPHAAVENLGGITPARVSSWFSKKAVTEGIKEGGEKGLKKFLLRSFLKGAKPAFGEGGEELVQTFIEKAARHYSSKPYDQATKDFAKEMKSKKTFDEMATSFAGGAIFGLAGGAFEAATQAKQAADGGDIDAAKKILADKINEKGTTPDEAQKLAKAKTTLEKVLMLEYKEPAITEATAETYEPAQAKVITPQEVLLSQDELRATEGTQEDYQAYQDEKQLGQPQPTTGIGLANKYMRVRNLPDDNPVKVEFMQYLESEGLMPIIQEVDTDIPADVRALDEAEAQDRVTAKFPIIGEYDQEMRADDEFRELEKAQEKEDSAIMNELLAEQADEQDKILDEGILAQEKRLSLSGLKERMSRGLERIKRRAEGSRVAKSLFDAQEIDYNRASSLLAGAIESRNVGSVQGVKEAFAEFKKYPIDLQEMVIADYEKHNPPIGKELALRQKTWKEKKAEYKKKKLAEKQAKTAEKKRRKAELMRLAEPKPRMQPTVETLRPEPANKVSFVKRGKVGTVSPIEAKGDSSMVEKRLEKKPEVKIVPFSQAKTGDIYETDLDGRTLYAVRDEDNKNGFGDKLWQTAEVAEKESKEWLERRRLNKISAEKWKKAEEERIAEEDRKRKEYADVDGFGVKKKMQQERILKILNKKSGRDGVIKTRKQHTRDMIAEGYTVGEREGKRVLLSPDKKSWYSGLTKTQLDYAEYLELKKERELQAVDKAEIKRAEENKARQKVIGDRKAWLKSLTDKELDEARNRATTRTEQDELTFEMIRRAEDKKKKAKPELSEPIKKVEKPEKAKQKKQAKKIGDFGEKLEGARKDQWKKYVEKLEFLEGSDITKFSISKIWPKPNYKKMLEDGLTEGQVSTYRALREAIEPKPKKSWRLEDWANRTKALMKAATATINGNAKIITELPEVTRQKVIDKSNLYELVGHDADLSQVRVTFGRYTAIDGKKLDSPQELFAVNIPQKSTFFSNWGKDVAYGKTKKEAFANFKKIFPTLDIAKKRSKTKEPVKFNLYKSTSGETKGQYFIGRKLGREVVRLKLFDSLKDANKFLEENREEVEKLYREQKKKLDIRKAENAPRVGKDYRIGKDVSPEQFSDAFGFRGVQFGNWVEGSRRQQDLNEAYDALMDLSSILNIPSKAISLNGQLGLAFGARGKSKAKAHYEPGQVVINLTKKKGAGSLAHEWFHALDNYFAKRAQMGKADHVTDAKLNHNTVMREALRKAFINLKNTIFNEIDIKKRAMKVDKKLAKDYWSTKPEIGARAFEAYIIEKLKQNGFSNDYLANIISEEAWKSKYGQAERYLYITKEEMPKVVDAFDNLFSTVQHGETDKGIELYSIEYLMARAVYSGFKQAKQAVSYGIDLLRQGVTKYAKWASNMSKRFGKAIRKHLKRIYEDAKKVLQSRRGGISLSKMQNVMYSAKELADKIKSLEAKAQKTDADYGELHRLENMRWRRQSAGEYYTSDGDNINTAYPTERSEVLADINRDMPEGFDPVETWEELADEDTRGEQLAANAEFRYDQANKKLHSAISSKEKLSDDKILAISTLAGDITYRLFGAPSFSDAVKEYNRLAEEEGTSTITENEVRRITGLYSVEYLAAKAIYKGYKLAKKALSYGVDMLVKGVKSFAKWSKSMIDKYGPSIKKHLRAMFVDANKVLKSRRGMIDISPTLKTATAEQIAGMNEKLVKSSDFKWKKESNNKLVLEFYHKGRNKYYPVATVLKDADGRWNLVGSNISFLTIGRARKEIKDLIYNKIRDTAIKGDRFKAQEMKRQRAINLQKKKEFARQRAKEERASVYFEKPTAEEKRAEKEAEKPITIDAKMGSLLEKAQEFFTDRRLALKKAEAQIEQNRGEPLPDDQKAYERYEVIQGRIEERIEDFVEKNWAVIKKMMIDNKVTTKDMTSFLYAMHAKERNDQIDRINPEFKKRGIAGSGMSNKEAEEIKKELFAKYGKDTLMSIGNKYWKMNSDLLKKRVEYGDLSEEDAQAIDDKYDYYAPLKHVEDDEVEPVKLGERAKGRRSKAQNILSFTRAAIDATFTQGEYNRAKQAFVNMAINNPSNLYSIERGEIKPVINDSTGEVEYKLDTFTDRGNLVHARFGGEPKVANIKDKGLLRALKRSPGELEVLEPVLKITRSFNKLIQLTSVGWNIGFMAPNFVRDASLAYLKSTFDKSSKFANDMMKEIPQSFKDIVAYNRGKDTAGTKLVKEFVMAGGKTGFTDMYDVQKRAEDLQKEISEAIENGTWFKAKKHVKLIADFVMTMNEVSESLTRFSAYKVARASGMSEQASAAYAKNLTVNFNKKGRIGTLLNGLYVFSNAGLQGTANVVKLVNKMAKSNKGKATIGAMIGLGFAQEMFNTIIGGIDPEDGESYWNKLAGFIKDSNFVMMLPGGKRVMVPLPYGLNVLPAVGRNIAAAMVGNQSLWESGVNTLGSITSAFNPLGSDARPLATLIPSIAKLPVDVVTNTKWTGKTIEKPQPMFGAKVPRHMRGYPQTSKFLKQFTQALSDATGGSDISGGGIDVSPAMIQYIIESYTGGVGKLATRGFDVVGRIASGEDIEPENIPVIRRFYGKPSDYKVYEDYKEFADIGQQWDKAKRQRDTKWMRNNRHAGKISNLLKATRKLMNRIKEAKRLSDADRKKRLLVVQKRFNKKSREYKQKYLSK